MQIRDASARAFWETVWVEGMKQAKISDWDSAARITGFSDCALGFGPTASPRPTRGPIWRRGSRRGRAGTSRRWVMYSNEEIARAAGYTPDNQPLDVDDNGTLWRKRRTIRVKLKDGTTVGGTLTDMRYEGPIWPNDPGACAEFLLPVLEARAKQIHFMCQRSNLGASWCVHGLFTKSETEMLLGSMYADSFHACVIAAIMATAPKEAG